MEVILIYDCFYHSMMGCTYCMLRTILLYTQNNWRVKYLANQSKIVAGITLIWRKAVAVSKHNGYIPEMASFKFGRLKIIRQNHQIKHFANYSVYKVIENFTLIAIRISCTLQVAR